MTTKVTLHVRIETHTDGIKVIGGVKRGDEVLHAKEVITDNNIESVSDVKESVGLEIEIWAVENTDFMPTTDQLRAEEEHYRQEDAREKHLSRGEGSELEEWFKRNPLI